TGTGETQTVTVPNNVTRFVFNFGGFSSDVINFSDSTTEPNNVVRQKLEAIPGIGPGNVAVSSTGTNPKVYTLTFQNALGGYDIPQASYQVVTTGTQEVQTITFS